MAGLLESSALSVIHTSVQLITGLATGIMIDYLFTKYVYVNPDQAPTTWMQAAELTVSIGGQLIVLCGISAAVLAMAASSNAPDPAMGLSFLLSSEYASAGLQQALLSLSAFLKSELSGNSFLKARSMMLESGTDGTSDRRTIINSQHRKVLGNAQALAIYQ